MTNVSRGDLRGVGFQMPVQRVVSDVDPQNRSLGLALDGLAYYR